MGAKAGRSCYTCGVRRAVALLTLCLVVGSASGAFAAMAESCDEQCEDGDEDCCPLVCPRCVCAARGVTVDVPHVALLPTREESRLPDLIGDVMAPSSADPREIFHIPIAAG